MRFGRTIAWLYAILCAGALALIPASANGWLGLAEDPLSAVFALMLAMPWSLGLEELGSTNPWVVAAFLAGGMALNFAILLWLARRWDARHARPE